jgi:molybdopterin-guanine dinucleotide biosynthesis protein
MKVIMLIGEPHSGKTTTINEVYKSLTGKYCNRNASEDFECVLSYQGKKIAFKSAGDRMYHSVEAMEKYSSEGCDILVCACRIYLIKALGKAISNFRKDFIPVFKTMPLSDDSNNADKNTILGHI